MLFKHELPILEYDTDEHEVLSPTHEQLDVNLPKRCVFAFLGDFVDSYAQFHGCEQVAVFESVTKNYPVYKMRHNDVDICFSQAPAGAAASVSILDWLIGYGVEQVIAVGCCGVLVGFPENVFLVPTSALRDEGTSYHYIKPARFIDISSKAVAAVESALKKNSVAFTECLTWTTDGFFRETKEMVEYRKSEGCSVVEMECAGLAACAAFRKIHFGELLFSADSLANTSQYDARGWGKNSYETAFRLALDAVLEL